MHLRRLLVVLFGLACCGCGTTRWSDTQRTATEQLLISDAIDRAVSQIDFDVVAGKAVYLDSTPVRLTVDAAYLISTLRQHLMASGCTIKDKADEADYVVEVRTGAMGTDRRDLLFGIPATRIPAPNSMPGVPGALPELPLATKTEQRGVAKIAVFAYNRHTGRPIWQSGVIPVESNIKHVWILGAGPFQRGSLYKGTKFADQRVKLPLGSDGGKSPLKSELPLVAREGYFDEGLPVLARRETGPGDEASPNNAKPAAPTAGPAPPGTPAGNPAPPKSSAAPAAVPFDLPAPPPGPPNTTETRPKAPGAESLESYRSLWEQGREAWLRSERRG